MSNYHQHCTEENGQENKKTSTKPASKLTSKPFCDCRNCMCKDCPDILGMLSITVTETSCDFGSKVATGKDSRGESSAADSMGSLLDVLKNRDCGCELVANAVRSNVHMKIGTSERRAAVNSNDKHPKTQKESSK